MQKSAPFRFRQSQVYGWPFYAVRKGLRVSARWMLAAADGLSAREKYPLPIFLKALLPANEALKGIHQGRRCLIIGNGPSLKSHNVELLAGEITIAMNGFINHPAIDRFQPTYYCLADPVYFDSSAPSNEFLERLFRTVPASHLILPCTTSGPTMEFDNPVSLVTFSGNLATARLRRLDLTRPLPSITNCAQLAIMLALYMGCSPIQLIGMDHDWLAHRDHDTHFYSQKTLANHAVAHGEFWRYPYRMLIEDVLKVWQGYETLRRYADSIGQQIFNCSDGGFLDVFERASLEIFDRKAA